MRGPSPGRGSKGLETRVDAHPSTGENVDRSDRALRRGSPSGRLKERIEGPPGFPVLRVQFQRPEVSGAGLFYSPGGHRCHLRPRNALHGAAMGKYECFDLVSANPGSDRVPTMRRYTL